MSRYRIKIPGGEVTVSSKDARYREERKGKFWRLWLRDTLFRGGRMNS